MSYPLVQPYLFFGGRCEEAIELYKSAAGAEVEMLMRFDDSPEPAPPGTVPENFGDKVMHASFKIGDQQIMASDGCNEGSSFTGFSLALSVETKADADRIFHALAEGGEVRMPLEETFWSPHYGQLTDRFGVDWMVMVPGESP